MTSRTSIALTALPPSSNNMFLNVRGKGRVRTKEYTRWADEAGWLIKAQRPPKFTEPVHVSIEIRPQNGRAFDLDNRSKALLDLLVTLGVIQDDSWKHVRKVTTEIVQTGAPCTVIIEEI